jgi:hypothetical protein
VFDCLRSASARIALAVRLLGPPSQTEEHVRSLVLSAAERDPVFDASSVLTPRVRARCERSYRGVGAGPSWREREKRRPRVIASRSTYASRGSVGL